MISKLPCYWAHHGIVYKSGYTSPCPIQVDQPHWCSDTIIPSEFLNTDGYRKIRTMLDGGKWPSGCKECMHKDKSGIESMRTFSLQANTNGWLDVPENFDYKESVNVPSIVEGKVRCEDIYHFEFRLNNSCNMACLHCDKTYSSQWESALKRYEIPQEVMWSDISQLKGTRHTSSDEGGKISRALPRISLKIKDIDEICDDLIKNFPNLRQIDVSGGEPLKMREFAHMLDRLSEHPNAKKIIIMFYTNFNADFDPKKLVERLSAFKHAIIHMSIDAGVRIYPYFRDGDWDKLKENIKMFRDHIPKGQEYRYHLCGVLTTSIFQVMDINNMFMSVMDLDIEKLSASIVHTPSYINMGILYELFPEQVKQDINRTRENIVNKLSNPEIKKGALESLKLIEEYFLDCKYKLEGDSWQSTKDGYTTQTKRFILYVRETEKLFNKDFNKTYSDGHYQIEGDTLVRTR